MIRRLIHKLFGGRKKDKVLPNNAPEIINNRAEEGLIKKIQDYSLSVLLGESRAVNIIAIHCSGSKSNAILNLDDAELFFKNKLGKKIVYTDSYIPYHFLVTNDGKIFETAKLSIPALSVSGHFNDGISICYVGGIDEFGRKTDVMTKEQNESITWLMSELKKYLGISSVITDN